MLEIRCGESINKSVDSFQTGRGFFMITRSLPKQQGIMRPPGSSSPLLVTTPAFAQQPPQADKPAPASTARSPPAGNPSLEANAQTSTSAPTTVPGRARIFPCQVRQATAHVPPPLPFARARRQLPIRRKLSYPRVLRSRMFLCGRGIP